MRKGGRVEGGECVENNEVRGNLCSGEVMKQYTTAWQSLLLSSCCIATVSSLHCLSIFTLTDTIQRVHSTEIQNQKNKRPQE